MIHNEENLFVTKKQWKAQAHLPVLMHHSLHGQEAKCLHLLTAWPSLKIFDQNLLVNILSDIFN